MREVTKRLDMTVYALDVKFQLAILKSVHAIRLILLYDYFRNYPKLIINCFEQAGRSGAIHIKIEREDPLESLL